jgi:hypothetical protein
MRLAVEPHLGALKVLDGADNFYEVARRAAMAER